MGRWRRDWRDGDTYKDTIRYSLASYSRSIQIIHST